MKRKYLLIDKETIEAKGEVDGWLDGILLHRKINIVLVVALATCLLFLFSTKSEVKRISMESEVKMVSVVDSMQSVIYDAKTETEVVLLHATTGKLSIMRGKPMLPTKDSLWRFIKSLEPWYPEYIMAQAIQETSCGVNCKQVGSHNMFGMKRPSCRETTATNTHTNDTYARYKSWELGVIDRVLWEINAFQGKKPTEEEYVAKLSSYGTAEGYVDRITEIAKGYKNK